MRFPLTGMSLFIRSTVKSPAFSSTKTPTTFVARAACSAGAPRYSGGMKVQVKNIYLKKFPKPEK